jgi:molybdate transport system substrate-binding protein
MLKQFVRITVAATVVITAGAISPPQAQQPQVTIFAAASMKNALDEINLAATKQTRINTVTSYAATSALMRQIEQGAPADVFISADLEWMDYGIKNKLLNPSTRVNLLGNRLVLIAPKNSKTSTVKLEKGFDLAKLVGIWSSVEKRMAMVENVRVALTLVARGEAEFGIVYATDARAEPNVKVVAQFPPDSHPEIIYPVAATAKANADAPRYIDYLKTATSKSFFERFGFSFLVKPAS